MLQRLIQCHESKSDNQLSRQIILKMMKHKTSNRIVTNLTLNKVLRKISKENKLRKSNGENGGKRKSCIYSYYYHTITSLIETRFFYSNKHCLVPTILLLYWYWHQSRVRTFIKRMIHLKFKGESKVLNLPLTIVTGGK